MRKTLLALAFAAAATVPADAYDLSDLGNLLGGCGGSDVLSNLIEGVFTKTDLSVSDLAGTYAAEGSAVTFKSDNALQKAGGIAAAAAVEAKLNPYYEKYGLIGAVMTADADGQFTLRAKRLSINGLITKNGDGTFEFAFQALGGIQLGAMTAYVQQTPSGLDVMFDASKLKDILSFAAGFSGSSLTSAASRILNSYDGICMGFKFKKTGQTQSTQKTQKTQNSTQTAADALRQLLKRN